MSSTALRPDKWYKPLDASVETSEQVVARLIAKLDELAPSLEAEVEENERIGRLGDRTLVLLREAEIPLLLLARCYGGHALSFSDSIRVIDKLVQIDASIGWIGGNWSSLGATLAYVTEKVARQILAEDPMPYIGASGAPTARAIPVEGGWLVTGKWQFGSGDLHGAYILATAMTCDKDGIPLAGPGGTPAMTTYMISTANMQNHGNWDVLGLRATGSVDFAFVDEFVPNHLVVGNLFGPPISQERRLGGGFRLVLSYLHTTFAMGAARRLLDEVAKHAAKPSRGITVAETAPFRIELGRQEVAVRSARAFVFETWATIDRDLEDGTTLQRRHETLARAAMLHMHTVLRDVARFAFARGGGTALRAGFLQRWIRDSLSGCQHVIANEDGYADIGWELTGAPENMVWGPFGLFPLPPAA